jgi:Lamin Tail Domain
VGLPGCHWGVPGLIMGTFMRRTRTLAAAAVAAAFAGSVLLPVQAQAATGSVHLYKIYYDSQGTDTRSNSSLTAEYVQIRNTTSKAVSLKGWTLTDASNHKYTFGTYSLGKGKTVTVRTGKGKDTTANRYQNRGAYVWNNDKDTASLKKASGSKVDTCSYNSTKADYKMC